MIALTLVLATAIRAQVATVAGVTTLTMGLDVGNGIVPPAPPSRVRVPPYERVYLVLPDSWTYPIQWRKDNQPIAGATGHTLTLPLATSNDSGFYTVTGAPFPFGATGIRLEVVEAGHVGNFSARVELAPGSTSATVGFVVTGQTAKAFFVRAVGPSLKTFGIARPVAEPGFRIFDATGKDLDLNVVRPTVVLFDWAEVFPAAGAFPLAAGEKSYRDYTLVPGAYTLQATDNSQQGGTLLLEVYEFPSSARKLPSVVVPIPPGG